MSYNAITTIVNLLSIIHPEQQQQEQILISKLNRFFNFDHNVFILDSSSVEISDRFINTNRLQMDSTPQTLFVVNNGVNGHIDGLKHFTKIQNSKNALVVLIPDRTVEWQSIVNQINRIIEIQSSPSMGRLHWNKKIGIFFQQFVGENDLRHLFQRCWERGIINIFAATNIIEEAIDGSLNIFTFSPFGTFQVVNVSLSEPFHQLFLNQNCNFLQYPLRLGGANMMRASDKLLWDAIFDRINSSFVDATNEHDVLPMLHYVDGPAGGYDIMYPMKMESEVVTVPQALPYSEFSAYLQSVASDELVSYSLITIIVLTAVLTILRCFERKSILLLQSVADVINLLMNDNGTIKYQRLTRAEVFLIVPLTFVGLIVVNGILSSLQSYLTRPILQPQIDDVDGIHRSNLKIFTLHSLWKDMLTEILQNQSIYRDWSDRIQVIDVVQLDQEINSFNTSISFLWNQLTMQSMTRIQKRFDNMRGYHIIDANIYTQHVTYLVNETFPFTERLNDITSRFKSAGLYDKWLRIEYDEFEGEIFEIVQRIYWERNGQSTTEPFTIPIFIVYGWIAGVVMLIVEMIWEKNNLSMKKRVRRCLN